MDVNSFNQELQKAKTLGEILKVVTKYYDVDKTVVSPIVKGTIISGLNTAITMTRCQPK